ncbi:MAG: 16S rRNA (uracil(1498)-N(3))-methyltransferase [Clostridia bacterium]|nr:16S rRNA (uracil(1498)-N(3))-methyltransferase [Clostridia bacterium]
MKKFFIEKENLQNERAIISGDEFFHLSKVLRSQVGEKVQILVGDEFVYNAEIENISKHEAICKILGKEFCLANPKLNITIFQGLPKGEKLEWIIQKTSELGASTLIPFESHFTIAKNNNLKFPRLEKIAQEACKQCGRSIPLKIEPTIKFKEIPLMLKNFDVVLFMYEHAPTFNSLTNLTKKLEDAKNIAIIVGSEGGFSLQECEMLLKENIEKVSLGKRILRTETASIAMCAYVSFLTNN